MEVRKFIIDGKKLTLLELRLIIIDLYCNSRQSVSDHVIQELGTVNTHFKVIYLKLEVSSQRELHRWAYKNGCFNNGYFEGEYLFENWEYTLPWDEVECTLV